MRHPHNTHTCTNPQQITSALKLIRGDDGSGRGAAKVKQLHDNANYFRRRLLDMGLHVLGDWDSPVMPIMVYHIGLLATLSRLLYARHIAMVVVGFPATALLLCRCRVCISASHSREDLDYALDCLRDLALAAGLDFNNRGRGLRGWWRRFVKSGFSLGAAFSGGEMGGGSCGGAIRGMEEMPALESPGSRRSSSGGDDCSSYIGDSSAGSSSTESSCSISAAGSRPSSAAGSWGGNEDRVLSIKG